MSRKLATTIKDSAIPGKYKRVLEAYAATTLLPSFPVAEFDVGPCRSDSVRYTLVENRAQTI
jgi:hypothetical protein